MNASYKSLRRSLCVWLSVFASISLLTLPLEAEPSTPRRDVLVWGDGRYGQLGDSSGVNGFHARATAGEVIDLIEPLAVSAGWRHNLVVDKEGSVWSWGANETGQLGEGTTFPSTRPIRIPMFQNIDIVEVAGGGEQFGSHSLGLAEDGTVWAWGYGSSGQLGYGFFTIAEYFPVLVTISSVKAIAAGGSHSLAVKTDGTVWAWGRGTSGQLGDGSSTNRSIPVQVVGITNAIAVAGGTGHSMALTSDGKVWEWGDISGSSTPIDSGFSQIVAIAAKRNHSIALGSDGRVWAWGQGVGLISSKSFPVVGLPSAIAVGAGADHNLAVATDGAVWAWGYGGRGQLGNDAGANSTSPVMVKGMRGATSVTGGEVHSLAMGLLPSGECYEGGMKLHESSVTLPGINFGPGATLNETTVQDRVYIRHDAGETNVCFRVFDSAQGSASALGGRLSISSRVDPPDPMDLVRVGDASDCQSHIDQSSLGNRVVIGSSNPPNTMVCILMNGSWHSIEIANIDPPTFPPVFVADP